MFYSGSRSIPRSSLSQCEVSNTVEVAEQCHMSFVRVDNQIGKCLLLLLSSRVALPQLILQGKHYVVCLKCVNTTEMSSLSELKS